VKDRHILEKEIDITSMMAILSMKFTKNEDVFMKEIDITLMMAISHR